MRAVLGKLNDIFDRSTKRKLVFAIIGSVVVAMLDTVAIALVLPLVDLATGASPDSGPAGFISRLLGNPGSRTLTVILTLSVVGLFVLKDLGSMAFMWWMTGFNFRERVKTSSRLLRHFLVSPYTTVARRSSSELVRTMNDSVGHVFNYTVQGLANAISSTIAVAAIVAALLVVAPLATLALVAYFGIAALLYMRVVKPRAAAAGGVMTAASVGAWRTAFAALGGIKELHIRGTQEHFVHNYYTASMRASQAGRVAAFLGMLPKYILEILFILAVGLVLLVSTASSGGSVVGLLALFVAAGFRALPSVTGLLGSLSGIKVGAASLDVIHDEVMAARRLADQPRQVASALPFDRELRLEDVTFRYPDGDEDVVRSVSLTIPRGSSLALVGGSGAGKTTLVDLILGLHQPSTGRILVDGVDITTAMQGWQNNVGYVPQDVYMLEATLAENIAFDLDRQDIDADRLQRAIRQAQLDGLVLELSEGVETQLGERGTRLSGGQRQRVGIARALYREPALLVLDEATSSLDNETEHRISRTISQLHGNVTVLIVAHRLSTVRSADQIAFLKGGHVATIGTFDEVRDHNPEFARLVELGSLEPREHHPRRTTPEADGRGPLP